MVGDETEAEDRELKKITSGMGYLQQAMAQLKITRYSHGAVSTVQEDRNGELEDLIAKLKKEHDVLQRMAQAWRNWQVGYCDNTYAKVGGPNCKRWRKGCSWGGPWPKASGHTPHRYHCLGSEHQHVYTSLCGGQSCFESGIKRVHEPLRRLLEEGKTYACYTMP